MLQDCKSTYLGLSLVAAQILFRFALGGEIEFTVTAPGSAARVGWPVQGGIPLAAGALNESHDVALIEQDGKVIRLQTEPMARWEDGSIKWLLIDFFADVDAGATKDYKLLYGADSRGLDAPGGSSLKWQKTDDGIVVDSGVLRAELTRRVVDRLSIRRNNGQWLDIVSQPGEMMVGVNGQNAGRYLSSLDPESKVVIEQSGPNRICVRISGWHHSAGGRRFAPYTLRIHAYAGKPYLRLFHTFSNSDLPERGLMTHIGMQVSVPVQRGNRISYGGQFHQLEGGWPSSLEQADWNKQQIVHDGVRLENDEAASGFLSIRTPKWTTACIVRDWRQLYPKKLDIDQRGIKFWIWPDSAGPLDLRREEQRNSEDWLRFRQQFPEAYAEWIDPGNAKSAGFSARRYRVAQRQRRLSAVAAGSALGLARTHELWLVFYPGEVDADQLKRIAAAAKDPLLPYVVPSHLDQTEVLGRVGRRDRQGKEFPQVENYIARKSDWIIRHQNEWSRWWGMLDYGDVQSVYERLREVHVPGQWLKFMGRHGWKNSEVDIPNHFMYLYLRSGERRLFRFYESMLRHMMDVDTMHVNLPEFEQPGHKWQPGEWTRGGIHRHSYNHWSGGPNIGHSWNEGLANYYFLTGDRRAYDVAMEVAEYSLGMPEGKVTSTFEKYKNHPNPKVRFDRSPANAYRIALKAYELTGDAKWKQHALRWRDYYLNHSPMYLEMQPATFHVTNYIARTLALDYHMFREPRVAEELVRIGQWQNDFMIRGYDERGLQYCYLAAAQAWWLTKDDRFLSWAWHTYLDRCRSKAKRAYAPDDFDQTHFYELSQLAFFLRACSEAGFSEAKPPPDPRR